jgi:gamma-glutamyl-gamma-aminobutyrate hydrolase PuuD
LTKSSRATSGRGSSSAARPVIGITAYVEEASYGPWTGLHTLVPHSYVRAVERAGGRPVVLPPGEEAIEETLDALHGIIFSGGSDLDPAAYGAEAHPQTSPDRPERDRGELSLLEGALARDMPVLAVCRGSQVMNVARGGDLVQHLPEVVGDEKHKQTPGQFADHDVRLDPASRAGALLGEHAHVKSHHHQGYGRIGRGLRETAWADDGTVEGLEDPGKRFAVGVLWHPEEGGDAALFEALVEEARRYRQERRR